MRAYCTYCSARKDMNPADLPASMRYLSTRIESVHRAAERDNVSFLILSGRFGLLRPDDLIPVYDHLLCEEEVGPMSARVAEQISAAGISSITFYLRSPEEDPHTGPYRETMMRACCLTGVALTLKAVNS